MTSIAMPHVARCGMWPATARTWVAAAFALLSLLMTGCGSKAPQLTKLGPDDVVLAFGDSLTFGTGASPAESYPAMLAKLTGLKIVREGVPGDTTSQGMQRLPAALRTHRPKLVMLCLGGNDMLRKVSDAVIADNLRAMIRSIQASGAAVVLIGVPKPALFGGAAKFYEELAKEFGLVYEGEALNDILRKPALKSDPIHPNAQGYHALAEAVAGLLKRSGAL